LLAKDLYRIRVGIEKVKIRIEKCKMPELRGGSSFSFQNGYLRKSLMSLPSRISSDFAFSISHFNLFNRL